MQEIILENEGYAQALCVPLIVANVARHLNRVKQAKMYKYAIQPIYLD